MADEVVEAPAPVDEALQAVIGMPGVSHAIREHAALVAYTTPAELLAVCTALRDEHGFAQAMVTRNARLRLVVSVAEGAAVPSVSGLWPGAVWWEREVWDLFGIPFEGLADHRRIVTDYGFEGHPLRKDFPLTGYLEVRYDDERKAVIYEPVKLTQEFRNFDFLSPWEAMTTLPGDEKARG